MREPNEIHVCVLLFVGIGGLEGLAKFEKKALEIVKKHHGELLSAFRPVPDATETPDEIHYLKFPNAIAFEAFKNDARHKELAGERAEAILRTEICVSNRHIDYSS